MFRGGYIYILTNKNRTTLYIGVTSGLSARLARHRDKYYGTHSFSTRYNLDCLVYYEGFDTITEAILRETQLKKWSRSKKEELIARLNPEWIDLSEQVKNF